MCVELYLIPTSIASNYVRSVCISNAFFLLCNFFLCPIGIVFSFKTTSNIQGDSNHRSLSFSREQLKIKA